MRVTFHGVRGSTPCQSDDIRRYGGNTSCVSVDARGQDPLLLDLGTGLRYYGKRVPDRHVVPWQLPAHALALGSCAGSSILHAAATRRVQPRRVRAEPGRRAHARRGRVRALFVRRSFLSASTSCLAPSPFTTPPTPSSRSAAYNVTSRLVPSPRPDARLSCRVGRVGRSPTSRIISNRSTVVTRRRPARSNSSTVSTC